MKAIFTTSAYPFHYGHLSLYKKAIKLFGKDNLSVAIGRNPAKDIDFNVIDYHLTPYDINYITAENIKFADFCEKNNISYLVRGLRNVSDVEYELNLDYKNKQFYSKLETVLLTAEDKFKNISSSYIRDLLKNNDFTTVKQYTNEDAMYRFINKKPTFVIFFGKSCIGKSYFLNKTFSSQNVINVDIFLWTVFEKLWGQKKTETIKQQCRELIYSNRSIQPIVDKYSTAEFWKCFFDLIIKEYKAVNIGEKINIKILKNISVYLLDFALVGFYWRTIPAEIKGKCYLIKCKNTKQNREIYINKKNFFDKINFLDKNYREPNYFDTTLNLQYEKL